MSIAKRLSPLLLAATVAGCGSAPEETVQSEPTPPPAWQIKIAGEEITKEIRRHNASVEAEADRVAKSSLDGRGRIFHEKESETVDIYSVGVSYTLSPITEKGKFLDNNAEMTIGYFKRDRSATEKALSDPKEFTQGISRFLEREREPFASRDAVELGDNGYKAVFNLQTNRVCVIPTATEEQDCFDARTLAPSTPLAKDIALIRKLGL